MRRDMTSSLRACLAAESWKRLFPNGAPKAGRPKKGEESNPKIGVTFPDFAMASFKVSKGYAEQALAILNFSPELLEVEAERVVSLQRFSGGKVSHVGQVWRRKPGT